MDEAPHAIFLSYSTPDAAAVSRLCEALRAAGLEVWFDQSELRGGDAWDASIRRQIRDCALFMPVISANTESRGEGYFRLEWRLAVERSHLMADDQAFLMPVVIDGTNEATARVPDRFRERQWTRLPGGECTPAFIEQVRRTLISTKARVGAASAALAAPASMPHNAPAPARRRHRWALAAVVAAVALAALVAGLVVRRERVAPPASATVHAAAEPGPAAADPKSIAVLPFVNLTGRADDAYLADGLQEEILNALARMRDLKVISRTSAGAFHDNTPNVREVGERLGVGSVLEGSIRREGSKLRLTVQLIDARNDHHLLAADYDRDLGHILGLQSEVARKVADALAATLSNYERGELERVATNSGDAYNLYLRAVAAWRQSSPHDDIGVVESRRLLEQALKLDPDYTDALAMLSQACTWQFFLLRHEADGACARKSYERAFAIDAQLPEAQLARGLYEMYVSGDLEQAIVDLDAVVRRRPNDAEAHSVLGFALRRRSRFDEALPHFTRAWDLDPLNHAYDGGAFTTLSGLRRYREVLDQTYIYQRRFPADTVVYIYRALIECRLQHSPEPLRQAYREHGSALDAGNRAKAEAEIARFEGRYLDAVRLLQKVPVEDPNQRKMQLGFLYWAAGNKTEAARLFREVEATALPVLRREPHAQDLRTRLAVAQSMLGEHAAALATVEILRAELPEAHDPINGPAASFIRSVVLVRAGRTAEGYAEAARLLRVPFGAPSTIDSDGTAEMLLVLKGDPHYDELINNAPRL
jgi:TolB-like protein